MKLKLSTHEIPLYKIASVTRIRHNHAQIRMHTGESILVRCDVRHPGKYCIFYPGTFEELKSEIKNQQETNNP